MRGLVLLFALLATPASAGGIDADLALADQAFAAGDQDEALRYYERALEQDPEQPHALLRSGMLLSWDRRFDEALERYDRLLASEPHNQRALLERAKVLSWDRRFDAAAEAFRSILRERTEDRDARLGLARTLSWSGRQERARAEYERLLEAEPDDADALVGVAQTWAWAGHAGRARRYYEAALAAEPGKKEAELGLAYLDLWAGDGLEAGPAIDGLVERYPDDNDVRELGEAYRRADSPHLSGSWDHLEDTDDNDLDVFRLQGGLGLWPRLDLTLGAARYAMDSPGRSASVDSVYATLGWHVARGHDVWFRLGNDRRERTTGESDDAAIGGVTWGWRFAPTWLLRLEAATDTFRYSTDILDGPGNTIDAYSAHAGGRIGERWRAALTLGDWEISDGNSRKSLDAEGAFLFPLGRARAEVGYRLRGMDYDRDLDNGYFDPQDFNAHLAFFHARARFARSDNYWDLQVEGGIQSFRLGGEEVSGDRVFAVTALLGFPFAERYTLEVYGNYSEYAWQAASGFESHQTGLRLRWRR